MSNFFDEVDPATTPGASKAPSPASTTTGNVFDQYDTGVTLNQQEQDTLNEVQRISMQSPDSFGLVKVSKDLGKGLATEILSLPQDIGSSLVQAGETTVEFEEDESFFGNVKRAFVENLAHSIIEGGADSKVPLGLRALGAVFSTGVDVLTNAILDNPSEKLVTAGRELIEENQKDLVDMNLIPEGDTSVAFNIGAGAASAFKSIGLLALTKNPQTAGAFMAWTINSRDYLEARRAGKTPHEAAKIAASSAAAQGVVEQIGGRYFLNVARESSYLRKVLFRTIGQSIEEGTQSAVEQTIKNLTDVRDTEFGEAVAEMAYSMAIAFPAAGSVVAPVTFIEGIGQRRGLDKEQSKVVAQALVDNQSEIEDAFVATVNKETTGLGKDQTVVDEGKRQVDEVIAAHEETIAPQLDPQIQEDPQTAAIERGIQQVMEQGVEGVSQTVVQNVGQKMIDGADLTASEVIVANDILAQARTRVAEEGAITEQDFLDRQLELEQQQTTDLKKEVDSTAALAEQEINTIKETAGLEPATVQLLEDRAALIAERDKAGTVADDLKVINKAIKDINKQLVGDEDTVAARDRLQELQDKLTELKQTDKSIRKAQRSSKARAARLAKEKEIEAKKPENQPGFKKKLDSLEKSSVQISRTNLNRAPIGERLSAFERAQNLFNRSRNRTEELGLSLNPMDVFFDMLDGVKDYKGANYRIFKAATDKVYTKYLNLKEKKTRPIKELTDKYKFNAQNYEKIGAWAVLQQEGGRQKLLDSGYTKDEIDNVKLSEKEMEVYQLMRKNLDSLFKPVQRVMRDVYNREVDAVKDYFPFLTDHDALATDVEIQDMLGDALPQLNQNIPEVEKGFTISRTGGEQRVRIDALGVYMRHVDNAAYLIEMSANLQELGALAQTDQYKEAVGDLGQQSVVEWLNLLSRKGNSRTQVPVLDALRRNIGTAILGFKLSTIFVQPTALADGSALIGGNYVSKGMSRVMQKEWREFLWNNVPEVRERAGDDPAYIDLGGNGLLRSVREAGFYGIKLADSLTASSVAIGAYMRELDAKGKQIDLKNPDADAIQQAQLMMRRTQASAFAKDAPPIITQGKLSGNESLDRLIFQFQTFMLNRWSLIKHDMWAIGIRGGKTKQAVNIATWMMFATAAEVVLRQGVKAFEAMITGDDPDPLDEIFTKKVVNGAVTTVPFVSQAISMWEYGSTPVPALSTIESISEKMSFAANAKTEERRMLHLTSAALMGVGTVAGIPGMYQADALLRGAAKQKKKSSNF